LINQIGTNQSYFASYNRLLEAEAVNCDAEMSLDEHKKVAGKLIVFQSG
jgi:hypothetical protein